MTTIATTLTTTIATATGRGRRPAARRTVAALRAGLAGLLLVAGRVGGAGPNLVANPGFETGGTAPDHWSRPDNLTVFWEGGGAEGKCLRLDTDVKRAEWEAHRNDPGATVKKSPTSGNKYDTVAGTVGVYVWSTPIPVEAGAWYLFEADAKGAGGEPFVYLKGYRRLDATAAARHGTLHFRQPEPGGAWYSDPVMGDDKRPARAGDYLQVYRARLICRGAGKAWRRFERALQIPATGEFRCEQVLLMLYAYWPPGEYFFDNISLRRITEAEAQAVKNRRGRSPTPEP